MRASANEQQPRIAAIILAAGRATRFGTVRATKLVALLDGKPLVRCVAEAALASRARPVSIVIGHAADEITAAIKGLDILVVGAPDYGSGIGLSLRAGLAALPRSIDGALILLADMPLITASLIDRLIDGFAKAVRPAAAVPVRDGRRGNPVILARQLFPPMEALAGDHGAGQILAGAEDVVEVPVDDAAVFIDVDTQLDLQRLNARSNDEPFNGDGIELP